jgi:hypothetical protein
MATPKIKTCPFCKNDEGIFMFHEAKNVGMSCPNCGTFGPMIEINLDLSEELMEELAVKEWNNRTKRAC